MGHGTTNYAIQMRLSVVPYFYLLESGLKVFTFFMSADADLFGGSTPTQTQMLQYAGMLTRLAFSKIHRAYHPILLRHGMDQETLDEWSRKADEGTKPFLHLASSMTLILEMNNMRHKLWVGFRFFWTRRRERAELPAPPLPQLPLGIRRALYENGMEAPSSDPWRESSPGRLHPYPAIKFYHTREEVIAALNERKATTGCLPKSMVEKAWLRKQAAAESHENDEND